MDRLSEMLRFQKCILAANNAEAFCKLFEKMFRCCVRRRHRGLKIPYTSTNRPGEDVIDHGLPDPFAARFLANCELPDEKAVFFIRESIGGCKADHSIAALHDRACLGEVRPDKKI